MTNRILVIHGPNLNLLGERELACYGTLSLDTLNELLDLHAQAKGCQLECFQSNAEHEIIDKIQQQTHAPRPLAIIINAAALTHTSIALRDALLAVKLPFYEVHLTNIFARESFRHVSYISDIAKGVICGLGPLGYFAALDAALSDLPNTPALEGSTLTQLE